MESATPKIRLWAALLLAVSLTVLMVSGCGGDKQPAKDSPAPKKEGQAPQQDQAKSAGARQSFELKMSSGPAGAVTDGLYSAVLDDLKKALPYLKGGTTTGSPVSNVVGLSQGKYNLVHSLTDITGAALAGQEDFEKTGALSGFSTIVTWWPMTTTWVVWADSPYKSIQDLKGKSVSPGPRGGSNDVELRRVLRELGLSYNDYKVNFLGFNDAEQQILDGHLDALLYTQTAYPHAGLLSIMAQKQVRFLPVPEEAIKGVESKYKGVTRSVLPKGTYTLKDGSPSPEMPGVGGYIHWLVKNDFPEDVAYDFAKVATENFERYQANFSNLKWMKVQDLAMEVPGTPLHPGARKYFKECGFVK